MSTFKPIIARCWALLLSLGATTPALAAEPTPLETEIEQLKQQVLELNRDLFILEEDLLFPANTQIAVFVSVDVGHFFKLDSVEVKLNDRDIAGALYTERQRHALEQGGIQRLFIGNVKSGEHTLTAIFNGTDQHGRRVQRAVNHRFVKQQEGVMLELKLADQTSNNRAEVEVEQWQL
ncbi:hypothetical protein [Ferrimonas senticii]|uniref:hypothetical protein n=1 Tax=Ferrimonas senticii TaxID=394566 RepID=UPI00040629F1|nr:hypothetical protein [Ferrimonas senticii]